MTEALELSAPFTHRMPYPEPFSYEERCTIEEAIREGLKRSLVRKPPLQEEALDEVKITAALEEELSSMMEDESAPVPGFTSEVFETIVRGGELCDWRGMKLEERPDLVIRRKKRPRGMDGRHFGLFVECKVVDADRVMYPYVQRGLRRFCEGAYAWAVPLALMVAYVDGQYQLPRTLAEYLQTQPAEHTLVSTVSLRDAPPAPEVYSTVHVRAFEYREGGSPGPVQIDHLWHRIR